MIEPRCKNCGHMKIAHTAVLLRCPAGEFQFDGLDKDGNPRMKIVWLGYLETNYKE